MLALIAMLFIVIPLVEIYVIVHVGHAIGALNTIALLFVISIAGAWLAKHEGFWVLSRLRQQLAAGRMPTNELIDGALVLSGAILMVFPGFVTDALGLLLLLPPIRAVVRAIVKRRVQLRVLGPGFGGPTRRDRGPDDPPDIIDV